MLPYPPMTRKGFTPAPCKPLGGGGEGSESAPTHKVAVTHWHNLAILYLTLPPHFNYWLPLQRLAGLHQTGIPFQATACKGRPARGSRAPPSGAPFKGKDSLSLTFRLYSRKREVKALSCSPNELTVDPTTWTVNSEI